MSEYAGYRQAPSVALFIDLENFIGGTATSGLPVEIGPIISKLKEFGSVRVRRSFGDLRKTLAAIGRSDDFDTIRRTLHLNLVEIEDIPYITSNKNASDVRLVVEALTLAFQNDSITHYVILASDRDYVPLFNKLRELGKTVVAVGIDPSITNQMIREASDHLLYYASLLEKKPIAHLLEEETADDELLKEYYQVLVRSLSALEQNGQKTLGTRVYSQMCQLRSDFSPQLVGSRTFKDFVTRAVAAGIVTGEFPDGPGDMVIQAVAPTPPPAPAPRPATGPAPNRAVAALERNAADREHLANELRGVMTQVLKQPFPKLKRRRVILESLAAGYAQISRSEGTFSLSEWKEEAMHHIPQQYEGSIPPQIVYKILLCLFFARCFHCTEGHQELDPTIVGLATPPGDWEYALHRHFVGTLVRKSGRTRIPAAALSLFLFEDDNPEHISLASQMLEEAQL